MNISVIIPVYNAEKFLEKSVLSALQFDEVAEILLCEDASRDNSLQVCQSLSAQFDRVKVFQHQDKGNHGAAESRNLGLEKAKGDFIAFLDADDYYLPNRFNAEREIFKDENIDGVLGALGIEYLSKEGKKAFQNKFKNLELTTVQYAAEGREIFEGLIGITPKTFGSFFHLNTFTLRQSAIKKHNLRFNKELRVHQDSDFIIKVAYHCRLKTGCIDKAIAIRGVHDDNRITKIESYSTKYYNNQLLLHTSLYEWGKGIKLERKYQEKFSLSYLSFRLANKKGFEKYIKFLYHSLKNPKLVKTRYRFHALNNPKK